MSLVIQKFAVRPLTLDQLAQIRRHGEVTQASRLSMCRACGQPILLGEMRLTGKVGYLDGVTVHIHQTCSSGPLKPLRRKR